MRRQKRQRTREELKDLALRDCVAKSTSGVQRIFSEAEAREVVDDFLAGDSFEDYAQRRLRHIVAQEMKEGKLS